MKRTLTISSFIMLSIAQAQYKPDTVGTVTLTRQTAVHDPVIIQQGDRHNSVYNFGGKYYIIYHGYDAKDKGRPKLIIDELEWDAEGWPKLMKK